MKQQDKQHAWKATRDSRRDARREEILRVATGTFNELGYTKASMAEISRRLGLTYNALYHYFDSKDEILYSCFIRSSGKMRARIQAAIDTEGTGLERVLCFVGFFMEFIQEETLPATNLILHLSPERIGEFRRRNREDLDALEAMFSQGIKDGSIEPAHPGLSVAFMLATLVNFPYFRYGDASDLTEGIVQFFERMHARSRIEAALDQRRKTPEDLG